MKVYKQRSVHDKEVVSDYPRDPVKVKRITKSLGQKFYEVEGTTHPVIRADLILHTKGESKEAPAAEEPKEEEPYMSYKRKRVRARDARNAEKAVKAAAKAEAKAKAKAAKAEEKAKKKEVTETTDADLLAFSKQLRERAKARFAARLAT